jgi:subtilase family serine protease
MTPPFQVKTIGQSPGGTPLVTSNSPTGLAPATVGAVYNLKTGLTSPAKAIGAGQVIAIVDAYHDPNALSDLNAFNAEYGYPSLATCSAAPPFTAMTGACFYQADPEGTPGSSGSDATGWILEESLDIEWAHAEAPGATIVLVEAESESTTNLMNAVSWANGNGATEVSMSWAGSEWSGETSYDSYFDANSTSTGAPILYTASAGDSGSGAVYPAASPNVIAVGGTTLNGCSGTSCADFSSETAWSGSGGGVSAYEKIPEYQSGYGGPVYSESSGGISALTGGMRAIPDVSFEADPDTGVSVYDSTSYEGQSGWWTIGGTSVGSPNWAGIFAAGAANATALQGAKAIYGGGYASYLRDITSGSNGYCGTDCTAGTGYDLVTGLGSPINYPPPPTVASVNPSSGLSTGGTAVTVTGTGFVAGSTTVDFGSSPATDVSVSSPEQLSATSPAGTIGEVNVTVTTPIGTSATGSLDEFDYVFSPQGNWVGTYGASGYALAAWNGSSDLTYIPDATLSLLQGTRYVWSGSTTDVRALESPDQSTREATCWYSPSELELQLSFSSAYSGNLELYALDWDSTSRRETIAVKNGSSTQTVPLTASFNEGAWVVVPISVVAGGSVTITVQPTAGGNAVLSGIFLG